MATKSKKSAPKSSGMTVAQLQRVLDATRSGPNGQNNPALDLLAEVLQPASDMTVEQLVRKLSK